MPGHRRRSYEIDMTNGPILGKLFRFAMPLALSGILQLLFNAADIVVVGRFAGSQALAAVGSTGALINLIVTLFMGISVGANVLVSQYYGAGDKKGLHETVHTAILSSLVFGIALIAVGIALARPMLEMMETPADVLEQAVLYMRIYFIGMPVLMLYNFGAAILRAVGDTQRPLYFLLLAGVVNVVLNLFFVIVLHMGVAGVAAATSISQAVSAFLVFWCLVKVDGDYKLYPKQMRIYKDKLWKMMKIGLPAGIQGASFSISNVLIQSSINSFGAVAMAGNTAGANIEGFVNMGMDSFSQAALSFTGQNLGAGKTKRVNRVMVLCLLMASATGLLLGLTANLFGPQLLGIYSSDPAVIEYGLMRLRITCMFQFAGGLMGVMVGVLRGMGASLIPMAITISSVCGFRVVWIFTVFAASPTLTTLYVSYPVTWALAAFFDFVCFFFVKRGAEKKQQLRQQPQG
ncbi:MATE family efflux transporter [bacterium D16-76]|nr:MATE family efflux transporter [bacterium D16-76]